MGRPSSSLIRRWRFLKCHGRVLKTLIAEDKVVHIDALPLYKKYTDIFDMDDVPEEERKAVARQVADTIIAALKDTGEVARAFKWPRRLLGRGDVY